MNHAYPSRIVELLASVDSLFSSKLRRQYVDDQFMQLQLN